MKSLVNNFKIIMVLLFAVTVSCTHDDTIAILPEDNTDLLAYEAADAVNGSRLYNDFTKSETGFVAPNDPTVKLEDITGFKDFYRCKQCHAWDLKAKFASYINRTPKVGRPDVSGVQLVNLKFANAKELFDKIKNTGGAKVDPVRTSDGTNVSLGGNNHPDYGTILTDEMIWDLTKFLKDGAFDTDQLYSINTTGTYPTGSAVYTDLGKGGSVTNGNAFYASKCASCHGADGTTPIIAGGSTLGKFARSKPYEVQHKTVSGQLGSIMGATPTTLQDMKDLLKALSDATVYPN